MDSPGKNSSPGPALGWYADPYSRYPLRYFDGGQWTAYVSDGATTWTDPAAAAPAAAPGPGHGSPSVPGAASDAVAAVERLVDAPVGEKSPEEIAAQAASVAGSYEYGRLGGGTVFTEPVLVVNQKAKIVELNNEYGIYDREGRLIGGITQFGQSTMKKVARLLTDYDQFMTHKLLIHDAAGTPLLYVERPAKVFKSRILVRDASGREVGEIKQENVFGKIRFSLVSGGAKVGAIKAQNWWAWNFRIEDHTGAEVARIDKTWEGLAKAVFTTADNYVVRIHRQLEEPLRSLVVASAVSVDLALKQDSRGLS